MAILGHVDRGWTLSFAWIERKAGEIDLDATASLQDALKRLLKGDRLGHALRPLARRYAFLAARLAVTLHRIDLGVKTDPAKLGLLWTGVHDARNFIVLGDPAVYLLGKRCLCGDTFQIDENLLGYAQEQARALGVQIDQWINQLVRSQALKAGFQL